MMFTIRRAQMQALSAARLADAQVALQEMLQRHWAGAAEAAGAEGVRRLAAQAIEAATARGLDDAGGMAAYLNVMMALGPDFEQDPAYAWARQVLDDTALRPAARMQRLVALVSNYLATAGGEGG